MSLPFQQGLQELCGKRGVDSMLHARGKLQI